MPDRATLEAARPKCPVEPGRKEWPDAKEPCRRPLRFDAKHRWWVCPDHGNVTTPESLVRRQTFDAIAEAA